MEFVGVGTHVFRVIRVLRGTLLVLIPLPLGGVRGGPTTCHSLVFWGKRLDILFLIPLPLGGVRGGLRRATLLFFWGKRQLRFVIKTSQSPSVLRRCCEALLDS